MKVAVIGSNGQLGSDIGSEFRANGDEVVELNHENIEVAERASVEEALGAVRPNVVVNTAAMHNVEACEQDPVRAFAVNAGGAENLALLSVRLNFVLVHISTDYVFDGQKGAPYGEEDLPLPLNAYGKTKLVGERLVQAHAPRHFILRTSALYGRNPCRAKGGLNFVTLMLKKARENGEVRVVKDEIIAPTYTRDLARQIVHFAPTEKYGLYHATSQGSCSWYEFAENIFQLAGVAVKLQAARPGEFPAKVPRPKFSALANRRLQEIGEDRMPHWTAGLKAYLRETVFGPED